jgi:hypothetical protein
MLHIVNLSHCGVGEEIFGEFWMSLVSHFVGWEALERHTLGYSTGCETSPSEGKRGWCHDLLKVTNIKCFSGTKGKTGGRYLKTNISRDRLSFKYSSKMSLEKYL